MPRNYLEDTDYCIRKAIGAYCIRRYLRSSGETQRSLSAYLDVSQGTISKWMSTNGIEQHCITADTYCKLAPNFLNLLKISAFFHKSYYDMLQDIIEAESASPLLCNDASLSEISQLAEEVEKEVPAKPAQRRLGDDHFTIINKLQKSSYLGFFISADDANAVEHFVIETAMAKDSAKLPATMRVIGKAGNEYECDIVSPPNQNHLYINIEQPNGRHDRGVMVFYVDHDMQGPFECGSGFILSTDRRSGEKRIQWVVIVRIGIYNSTITPGFENLRQEDDTYDLEYTYVRTRDANESDGTFVRRNSVVEADSVVGPVLREDLPVQSSFHLSFACLKTRQKRFYSLYKKQVEELDFAGDWKSAHR